MKIFVIIGKSSTGKDTIYKKLLNDKRVKLQGITTYTTRPIRSGEKDGVEYYFKDIKEAFCFYKQQKEKNIKEMADLYKDKIPLQLYKAMYQYEVEISD